MDLVEQAELLANFLIVAIDQGEREHSDVIVDVARSPKGASAWLYDHGYTGDVMFWNLDHSPIDRAICNVLDGDSGQRIASCANGLAVLLLACVAVLSSPEAYGSD